MRKENIFEAMQNDIMNANLSEAEKNKMLKNVMRLKEQKVNIMVTGATGCSKSSTINAMFDIEVANVGVSKPIFYSAERGCNVDKLLDMIIDNMPRERRR